MKKLFTILLCCSSLLGSFAQTTYTSTGSGDWSQTSTFSVSGSGTPIYYVISAGDTVTVDVASTTLIENIYIYGTLLFNNGRKISMTTTGTAQVYTGGEVTGGNGGSKFTFSVGTDVAGPFNVTIESYATAWTYGQFIAGILPVTWMNFTTKQTGDNVHVNWQTASEKNSMNFIVQTSTDGKTWTDLSTLAAAGNSSITSSYSYVQPNPAAGQHFYRISQTDLDGSFSFSEINYVFIRNTTAMNFYPNPVKNTFSINSGADNTLEQVEILSPMGIRVTQPHSFNGNNIDISLLPAGIYMVHAFISNGEQHTLRVIKE